MSHTEQPFAALMARLRAGDEQAAAEMVRQYEPAIRRAVRFRLAHSPLHRFVDSVDLSQSVFASFFLRAGQFEVEEPEQLAKLLITIARNKLAEHFRAGFRQCRSPEREESCGEEPFNPVGREPTPSRNVSGKELLALAQRMLSGEEQQLLAWRQEGKTWEEIAQQCEGTPDALRKKLSRALDQVAHRLGLDDYSNS
jgi:RNA polymerase sigma-70 factor (ECF subfamily)